MWKTRPSSLSPDNGRENFTFWVAVVAAVVIFAFVAAPLLGGRFYTFDDLGRYHLPFRYFYAQSLAAGDSFTWLPNIYSGFYLHGDGSVGMYHPLHLLLYRTLPFTAAFNVEMLLNYPLAILGMFLFLRRWKLPRDASMLGAIIFGFSGFNTLHFTHMNAVVVSAHIPWLLLAVDVFMREDDGRMIAAGALGVALLTGSELLLGHPQVFWFSAMIEGLYALLLAFSLKRPGRLLALGIAKTLGIMVGGAQLLPTWEAVAVSIRPETFARNWPALDPIHLMQLVAPYFFNDQIFEGVQYELKAYNGAIPLAALALLAIRRKKLGAMGPLAVAALALGALGIILSLGDQGFIYRIHPYLPFVGVLRAPCRYILLFHLASAIWTAIALASLSGRGGEEDTPGWKKLWPILIVALIGLAPALLSLWLKSHPNPALSPGLVGGAASGALIAIGPVIFCAAALMVALGSRGKKYALAGIIIFTAVDLGAYGVSYMWSFPRKEMGAFLASRQVPPDAFAGRLKSGDNALLMKGVRITEGYVSIPPRKLLAEKSEARLKLAGARWVWSKRPKFKGGTAHGVRLPAPLPRARLVTEVVTSDNPGEDVENIDLETTALVEEPITLGEGPAGEATITEDRPGRIMISTESGSRQLLALSESYHRGWRAAIDGEEAPVIRVYGDFMGCVVEAGGHKVEFTFRPQSLRAGAMLSALGIALSLAFAAAYCLASGKKKVDAEG